VLKQVVIAGISMWLVVLAGSFVGAQLRPHDRAQAADDSCGSGSATRLNNDLRVILGPH